jgi:hypothetical protein
VPQHLQRPGEVASHTDQLRVLSSVIIRTAGIAAVRRGLPLYSAVFIAAIVIFVGKYAMKASELVGLAHQSLGFRCCFLLAWLILTLPVARAWVASPSTFHLRVFPVPWTAAVLVVAVGLLLVELPWIILFSAGGGPVAGAWAAVTAAGAHALSLGRPRKWYEAVGLALWVMAFAFGPGPLLALALPALVLGCRRAWIDAWGAGVRPAMPWVLVSSPSLAMATAHLASLLRHQRPLLSRWAWLGAAGVGSAILAIRSNEITTSERMSFVSMAVLAPITTFNVLAVGAAFLRIERRARWLLDVVGTSRSVRLASAALALGASGLAFGLAHGAVIALVTGGSPRLWVGAACAGVGFGVVGALAVRWADRGTGQDAGRFVAAGVTVSAGVIALGAWLGETGVGLALVAAGVVAGVLRVPKQPPSVEARAAADQD